MIATTFAAVLLTATSVFGSATFGTVAAQDDGNCLRGREVQEAIDSGQIMELADAMSAAGIEEKPLSQPEVCDIGGQLQYRVNIMNSYGQAERVVLNARGN